MNRGASHKPRGGKPAPERQPRKDLWSPEEIELARHLWDVEKLTAGVIAKRLPGRTAGAVEGASKRYGFDRRPSPIKRRLPKPAAVAAPRDNPPPVRYPKSCQWPPPDGPCKTEAVAGRPYCTTHMVRAYPLWRGN